MLQIFCCLSSCSYIKPQPPLPIDGLYHCCLSSCSYIKPQQCYELYKNNSVVYHLVPTSNHNSITVLSLGSCVVYHLVPTSNHNNDDCATLLIFVVYHLVPTSNHNIRTVGVVIGFVVYHLVPTSNHNLLPILYRLLTLFIILFLHQTTTLSNLPLRLLSCLSSCSYIKPQPIATNLLVITKILRFELLRNGRAGRILLQIY